MPEEHRPDITYSSLYLRHLFVVRFFEIVQLLDSKSRGNPVGYFSQSSSSGTPIRSKQIPFFGAAAMSAFGLVVQR